MTHTEDHIDLPDQLHILIRPGKQILAGNPLPDEEDGRDGVLVCFEAEVAKEVFASAEVGEGWFLQEVTPNELTQSLQQGIRDGDLTDGFVWLVANEGTYGVDLLHGLKNDDPTKCNYCGSDLSDAEDVTLEIPFNGKTVKGRVIKTKAEAHVKQCRVCGDAVCEAFSLPVDPDHPTVGPRKHSRRKKPSRSSRKRNRR